jgi:hypothetical protein
VERQERRPAPCWGIKPVTIIYVRALGTPETEYDAVIAQAVAFLEKHRSALTDKQSAEIGESIARLEAGPRPS